MGEVLELSCKLARMLLLNNRLTCHCNTLGIHPPECLLCGWNMS